VLKPFQSFRRNDALSFWTSAKAESEKLPFLWSRHRALRFIYFELEFVRDEARNALHHSLTGPSAAHVDVAIIRVSQVAVATTLELSVEFVEHEVGQQWRKHSPYAKGNFGRLADLTANRRFVGGSMGLGYCGEW
jgi:hypothetical protein